jgi:hypothetical protein
VAARIEIDISEDGRDDILLEEVVPLIRGKHAKEWAVVAKEVIQMGKRSIVVCRLQQLAQQGKPDLAAKGLIALAQIIPLIEVRHARSLA